MLLGSSTVVLFLILTKENETLLPTIVRFIRNNDGGQRMRTESRVRELSNRNEGLRRTVPLFIYKAFIFWFELNFLLHFFMKIVQYYGK